MKLFILAFDHRTSFLKNLEKPNKKKAQELKQIIFNGFLNVYNDYKKKKELAILIDEKYGEKIIKEAKHKKIALCLSIEKSGKNVLELAYKDLNEIKKIDPDYIKALVRYNPLNVDINKRQIACLKKVNNFCNKNNYKLILELLVPPAKSDLELSQNYDIYIRPKRTCGAIKEIQENIKVDIWKLEGFTKKQWNEINKTIRDSKIIFLGRGESKQKVKKWLIQSKGIKNIIGFAIGRTLFMDAIDKYNQGLISKEKASQKIAKNFKYFIDLSNQ